MGCSYCIVPQVRPTLSSRPAQEVVEEIRSLCTAGYREIVLTGIHLGHYGLDNMVPLTPGPSPRAPRSGRRARGDEHGDLADLVEQILRLEGDFRIRLSSIEAAEITSRLTALMAQHPQRICPHVHLPLQSGSDRILSRMRRRYDSGQFLKTCRAVAQQVPDLAITTDVIVGFPGESESDFEATCRVVEEIRMAKIHIFRYSPREGTIAAQLPDQIPEPVKQRRAAELARIGRRLHRQYLSELSGRRLHVLVESCLPGQSGLLLGTSGNYASVELQGTAADEGRLLWGVAGEVVEERIRVAPVAQE